MSGWIAPTIVLALSIVISRYFSEAAYYRLIACILCAASFGGFYLETIREEVALGGIILAAILNGTASILKALGE